MKGLAAILMLLAGCACGRGVPESVDPAAEIWAKYADGVDDAEVSVALVRDGVPAFAGDPSAIYRLGPLTGFFVIEAALRIEERGEIDLDRPLTAFARFSLDPLYGRVTMRELAELVAAPVGSDGSLAFLAERFPWASDARIALFAALLENAVGKPLSEIVRDEIALPLGLRATSFAPSADKLANVEKDGRGFDGLYSSAEDCVKFFASSGRILASALLRRRRVRGVELAFAVGRTCGGRRFVAGPAGGRDFLLIFRNVTSWSQYGDLESASKAFAR